MLMGLECEIPHITARTASLVDWCRVDIHDDGSIRNENYTIDDVAILPMRRRNQLIYPSGVMLTDRFGAEIVTQPYEYEELRAHAVSLASMFGHVPTTPRSSIHVHVDVIDKPWTYVQNLMKWFVALEAPLYRLSALGEEHRGVQWFEDPQHRDRGLVQQDHNYARPLTNSIGISNGRRNVPLIDIAKLLTADTASSFVSAWGRLDLYWGGLPHYCPHRLHAINIVPLLKHHTIEWRMFNGRYRFIPKVLDIVHAMHKLAERPFPDAFPVMPLGSKPKFTATEMSVLLGVDVYDVWGSAWVPGCREYALASHYRGDFQASPLNIFRVADIWNNARVLDEGRSDFCFGVSSARRGIPPDGRRRQFEPDELPGFYYDNGDNDNDDDDGGDGDDEEDE